MNRLLIALPTVSGQALRQFATKKGWVNGLVTVFTSDDGEATRRGNEFVEKISRKKLSQIQHEFDLNWDKNPDKANELILRSNEVPPNNLVVYITDKQYFEALTSQFKGERREGEDVALIHRNQVFYYKSSDMKIAKEEPVGPISVVQEEPAEEGVES